MSRRAIWNRLARARALRFEWYGRSITGASEQGSGPRSELATPRWTSQATAMTWAKLRGCEGPQRSARLPAHPVAPSHFSRSSAGSAARAYLYPSDLGRRFMGYETARHVFTENGAGGGFVIRRISAGCRCRHAPEERKSAFLCRDPGRRAWRDAHHFARLRLLLNQIPHRLHWTTGCAL